MDVEAANPWLSACQTPAEAAEAAGSDVGVPVWGFDPGIPVAGTGYLPVVASPARAGVCPVSYPHPRAHEPSQQLVCRPLAAKQKLIHIS